MTNAEVVEYVTDSKDGAPPKSVAWFVMGRTNSWGEQSYWLVMFTWHSSGEREVIRIVDAGPEQRVREIASKVARIIEQEWRS